MSDSLSFHLYIWGSVPTILDDLLLCHVFRGEEVAFIAAFKNLWKQIFYDDFGVLGDWEGLRGLETQAIYRLLTVWVLQAWNLGFEIETLQRFRRSCLKTSLSLFVTGWPLISSDVSLCFWALPIVFRRNLNSLSLTLPSLAYTFHCNATFYHGKRVAEMKSQW